MKWKGRAETVWAHEVLLQGRGEAAIRQPSRSWPMGCMDLIIDLLAITGCNTTEKVGSRTDGGTKYRNASSARSSLYGRCDRRPRLGV